MAFSYDVDFEATDPAVVAPFARTFQHENWTDGVSTIQAESNGAEEGFNTRFHKIENDLDRLGPSLQSLTDIRSQLAILLRNIRDELVRLDDEQGPAWNDVTPAAGWTRGVPGVDADEANPLGWFADRGVVHLRGALSNPGTATNVPVAKLPVAPEFTCVFGVLSGAGAARVQVFASGDVVVKSAYGGWISLDGLQFRRAASA